MIYKSADKNITSAATLAPLCYAGPPRLRALARATGVRTMKTNKPTYLIAELAGDIVPLVYDLRKRFSPGHVNWPVDITIAGSSGIGTIQKGQEISEVIDCLKPIISNHGFSEVSFTSIDRFPETGMYHLVPEREQFDILHQAVAKSDLLFNENRWPYNPHCTLRAGIEVTEECDALFKSMSIPRNVTVECYSLYQPEANGGSRVHRF
jgi:hypothetical protein